MKDPLDNPVFNALLTGDKQFSNGTADVKYFDLEQSPFAGFSEENLQGFSQLHDLLPEDRLILFAKPSIIAIPEGWNLLHHIPGLQFIYEGNSIKEAFSEITALNETHIDEMINLVKLTKPGPFGKRTIDFGSYYGIFEEGKLVSMTGQRLHVNHFTELSAVCTHPNHAGKGYAFKLMKHQLQIILSNGQKPFLHVKDDNERAIALYERLGFRISRPMHFYFIKRI